MNAWLVRVGLGHYSLRLCQVRTERCNPGCTETMNVALDCTDLGSLSLSQVDVSTQHQNVSEMMSSWTSQKGFPLVTVSRKGDEVTLTQEHFLLTSDNATHTSR